MRQKIYCLSHQAKWTNYKGERLQLVNIMPKTPEEIRTYLLGWKKIVPTETLIKINEILNRVKK